MRTENVPTLLCIIFVGYILPFNVQLLLGAGSKGILLRNRRLGFAHMISNSLHLTFLSKLFFPFCPPCQRPCQSIGSSFITTLSPYYISRSSVSGSGIRFSLQSHLFQVRNQLNLSFTWDCNLLTQSAHFIPL